MKKQIDLKKTKVYSDFVFDFLNENKTLKDFYNLSFDIKNFKKQLDMKKSFPLSKRNVLVKELLSQYSDIEDKKVLKELEIKFYWKGKGVNCKCYNEYGEAIVECDKEYFRPLEVDTLLGDSKKARKELNWKPKFSIRDLVKDMVKNELINLDK